MNRLGFRHDNLARTLPEVAASRNLSIDAVYTHFATADEPESAAFREQRERFEAACATLQALGIAPRARHAANSAAILRDERVWYDFVRPGLLRVRHRSAAARVDAVPATCPVTAQPYRPCERACGPGKEPVTGCKSVVDRPSTIAVVPAGYADGLDRRLAGPRLTCSFAAAARRSSARSAWT